MSQLTYFIQQCPTCGRRVQVSIGYLGKKIACQHCDGQFVAQDPDLLTAQTKVVDHRVNQLLSTGELFDINSEDDHWFLENC